MIVVDSSVAFAFVVARDAYHLLALARRLGCSLVTTDRQILDHYPNLAVRLEVFASHSLA